MGETLSLPLLKYKGVEKRCTRMSREERYATEYRKHLRNTEWALLPLRLLAYPWLADGVQCVTMGGGELQLSRGAFWVGLIWSK